MVVLSQIAQLENNPHVMPEKSRARPMRNLNEPWEIV